MAAQLVHAREFAAQHGVTVIVLGGCRAHDEKDDMAIAPQS